MQITLALAPSGTLLVPPSRTDGGAGPFSPAAVLATVPI